MQRWKVGMVLNMCIENLDLSKEGMENYDMRSGLANKPVSSQDIHRRSIQRIWVNSS